MTPADIILGFIGSHAGSRMALIGHLMSHGYKYDDAERECGQAILALVRCGRIESFGGGDIWRISAGTPMKSAHDSQNAAPTKRGES